MDENPGNVAKDWSRRILSRFVDAVLANLASWVVVSLFTLIAAIGLTTTLGAWMLNTHAVVLPGILWVLLALLLVIGSLLRPAAFRSRKWQLRRPRVSLEFIYASHPQLEAPTRRQRTDILQRLVSSYNDGSELLIEIAEDRDESNLARWRGRVKTWAEDVQHYMRDNVSSHHALYVDTVIDQPDVTVRQGERVLSKSRGYIIQDLQIRLKQLKEMIQILRCG